MLTLSPRESLLAKAKINAHDIVTLALEHTGAQAAFVVSDDRCELSQILTAAYNAALPHAVELKFYDVPPEEALRVLMSAVPGDLVVLIQSVTFRLDSFRIRTELLKRGVKVIEHGNLGRNSEEEVAYYIESLAYDPAYYRGVGNALKEGLDGASRAVVESGGASLVYAAGFESAKLNTGDFAGLKNAGSAFPIGEVFTESRDLEQVSGRVRIFAFADTEFFVRWVDTPITLVVNAGRVVEVLDSTEAFDAVIAKIKLLENNEVWVRELGLGLNRAFTRERRASDVGAYERICGVHLSLGAKHGVYKKPMIKADDARFHIDVFVVTERVLFDDRVVYQDNAWTV